MSQQVSFLEPEEVASMLHDDSAYVIDVREADEYAQGHIAGVPLMPLSQFDPGAVSPPEDKVLIIHCRSGRRCGLASEQLVAAGYKGKIYRMAGGILAWTAAGLPVEAGSST